MNLSNQEKEESSPLLLLPTHFEPEIPVKVTGMVILDDEDWTSGSHIPLVLYFRFGDVFEFQ